MRLPYDDDENIGRIYSSPTFQQLFPDADTFVDYYKNNGGIPATIPESGTEYGGDVSTLYWLLYSRHGEDPIAGTNPGMTMMKMMSIIFSYGPAWSKKLEIQYKLRKLQEDDILTGSNAIYNRADHPGQPIPNADGIISAINEQNTQKHKKGKVEGYSQLQEMLTTDVTGPFLSHFDNCFRKSVAPDMRRLYVNDPE